MSAVLIDTNVLIYARDTDDHAKHVRARETLSGIRSGDGFVSIQVLSECASVMTHPRKKNVDPALAGMFVRALESEYGVIPVTATTVLRALDARIRWQLSYWDAQIWASAALAGVPVVLSEDFADGLQLGPVRFVDPFAEGFDIAALE